MCFAVDKNYLRDCFSTGSPKKRLQGVEGRRKWERLAAADAKPRCEVEWGRK